MKKLLSSALTLAMVTTPAPTALAQTTEAAVETQVEARAETRKQNVETRQDTRIETRTDRQLFRQEFGPVQADRRLQRNTNTGQSTPKLHQGLRDDRQDNMAELQEEAAQNRSNRRKNLNNRRADIQAEIAERKTARVQKLADLREHWVERKNEFRQNLEERLALSEEKRAANRARFNARAQERIDTGIERLNNQYQNYLERAESIFAKIEARVAELEERGIDTSSLDDLLAKARTLLDQAGTIVIQAQTSAEAVVEVDDVRTLWQNTVAAYHEAREIFIELKNVFGEILKELKQLSIDARLDSSAEADLNS